MYMAAGSLGLFTSALAHTRPRRKQDLWPPLPESGPVRGNYAIDEGTRLVVFPFYDLNLQLCLERDAFIIKSLFFYRFFGFKAQD